MTVADLSHLVAIVPVRSIEGAKSRLGEPLDPEERGDLVLALLQRTVQSAASARGVAGVVVVSKDPGAIAVARAAGVEGLMQRTEGLNEGLAEARDLAGATAILVLPADLPNISAAEVARLVDAGGEMATHEPERPVVVLVPDQHGSGTNALLLAPPAVIPFMFGESSRFAHAAAARAAGASYAEVTGALAFDLDTPDDLLAADLAGLGHEAGR
jgi:2-phospho-L-lactate/phosphoenolpyruvate guanylyltransferase